MWSWNYHGRTCYVISLHQFVGVCTAANITVFADMSMCMCIDTNMHIYEHLTRTHVTLRDGYTPPHKYIQTCKKQFLKTRNHRPNTSIPLDNKSLLIKQVVSHESFIANMWRLPSVYPTPNSTLSSWATHMPSYDRLATFKKVAYTSKQPRVLNILNHSCEMVRLLTINFAPV